MDPVDQLIAKYGVELVDAGPGVISLDAHRLLASLELVIESMDELCDRIEKLPPGVRHRVRAELAARLDPEGS